jgi:hypothetical protein
MALWKPSRRLFLAGAGLIAAPAIVRAQSPQIRQLLLRQQPAVAASPAFAQGIYFRASNDQVSPTNYDVEIATSVNYPRVSAQGNNVGWSTAASGVSVADRNATTDVRLKGIAFVTKTVGFDYRISLPSPGTYNIRAALGDSSAGHDNRLQVFDNVTQIWDKDAGATPAGQWMDANGIIRTSEANWVSNNTLVPLTFASSIAIFRFGNSTGVSDINCVVSAIFISS